MVSIDLYATISSCAVFCPGLLRAITRPSAACHKTRLFLGAIDNLFYFLINRESASRDYLDLRRRSILSECNWIHHTSRTFGCVLGTCVWLMDHEQRNIKAVCKTRMWDPSEYELQTSAGLHTPSWKAISVMFLPIAGSECDNRVSVWEMPTGLLWFLCRLRSKPGVR